MKNKIETTIEGNESGMNKKEVLEIRKQFTPENSAITRICGCYVDHEKEKKTELKKLFVSSGRRRIQIF